MSPNFLPLTQPPFSRAVALKLECASESPRGLVKRQIPGPNSRISDSGDLGWGLRMCIPNKFQVMLLLGVAPDTHQVCCLSWTPRRQWSCWQSLAEAESMAETEQK